MCGESLTPIDFDWDDLEYDFYTDSQYYLCLLSHIRVRANIRNTKEGFNISDNYFLNCLYPRGYADAENIEKGYLRSRLLLQVRLMVYSSTITHNTSPPQVYCSIFTSPSSAESFDEETEDGPARKAQKTVGQKKATKTSVASLLNMDGKVTGRSIAYAAALVRPTNIFYNRSLIFFYLTLCST